MRELKIAAYAQSLDIHLANPTEDSLRHAILSELMKLQGSDLSSDQTKRRRVLTDGLVQLRDGEIEKRPSTELVPISPNAIAEIVKAAVMAQNAGPSTDDKMRTGVHVAATQAKKDFRHERTWPLAGFGAFVAFIWSQREAFGVDLSIVGSSWWSAGALALILLALVWYFVAYGVQQSDESRLRRLYSPDTQALALRKTIDEPIFTLEGYGVALEQASQSFSRQSFPSILSTVDIESAVDDASMLALERFVKLGVIEPVDSMTGAEYRLSAKYRAEHPMAPPSGETV